tara:strand:- start:106 stop:360 length:255 start_codon:yes stop_codon:yes gene_type:complete
MGARSRKMSKREIESLDSIMPFSSESMTKDAQKMREDLGPRPYGAPPRFAGDDPWLSPETWPAPPYRGGDTAFRDPRHPNRKAW